MLSPLHPVAATPRHRHALLPALCLLLLAAACAEDEGASSSTEGTTSGAGSVSAATSDSATSVDDFATLRFEARVGEQPFACGTTFDGLGVTESTFEPMDFRMYVSAFEVRDSEGVWQPLELRQDTPWQHASVALLDFEDRSGACANGTTDTREVVEFLTPGLDADASWDAIRFEIGVPFELNHADVAVAPSPLNLSAMFWNWQGGYKFIRLEGRTEGLPGGWQLHLGSTACQPAPGGGAESCDNGNRIQVEFEDFAPQRDRFVLDIAELLVHADLDVATENTPGGCMAGPDDPDCTPIFRQFGLAHGETAAGQQAFVHVERN